MTSFRYIYNMAPPRRQAIQSYSPIEQLVHDQIIAAMQPCYQSTSSLPYDPFNLTTHLKEETDTTAQEFVHPSTVKDLMSNSFKGNRLNGDHERQKDVERIDREQMKVLKSARHSLDRSFLEDSIEAVISEPTAEKSLSNNPILGSAEVLSGCKVVITKNIEVESSDNSLQDNHQNNQQISASHATDADTAHHGRGVGNTRLQLNVHLKHKDTNAVNTPCAPSLGTPTHVAKKRKSYGTCTPSPAREVNTDKYDSYIIENCDRLVKMAHSSEMIALITIQLDGDKPSKQCIQISLTLEAELSTLGQWESFILVTSQKTSHEALCAYRLVLRECILRGRLVCNDAKSAFGQLISALVLLPEDLTKVAYDDVTLATWLLNSDSFTRDDILSARALNDVKGQAQLASKVCSLFSALSADLKSKEMWRVYQLELSILTLLITMENKGLHVDMKEFLYLDRVMMTEIKALEKRSQELVGSPVSLNSTAQLRQVLYDRLRLDRKLPKSTQYKTAKNQETSTSEGMLNQLVPHHPLPKIILNYRQIYKIHSTYISGMICHVTDGDIIAPYWDQTAASTGRLQSAKPNIQSVPKTAISWIDESGNDVEVHPRSVYTARDGHTFLAVDFKQIEFRIFAHITADQHLLQVLRDDKQDVFRNLTAVWMSKKLYDVTASERERTKRIVYSVMYGVGKYRLSQQLNVTPLEAQSIMKRFLTQFPGIRQFSLTAIESCKKQGYAVSMLGRQRILPSIHSKDFKQRTHAERQAVNFTIQGSAADICKIVMREIAVSLRKSDIDASLLVQIHDELLYEVKDEQLVQAKEIIGGCMETDGGEWYENLDLKVPLRIVMRFGKNWAHMREFDEVVSS